MEDKKEGQQPDDDNVIFIPDEYVRSLERIIYKMEQAQKELLKVAEGMKIGEN
jgi:hypothetical protein